MKKRVLVDQTAWATPEVMTLVNQLDREQLLDLIECLLSEKERDRREKSEILDLLSPPRPLPKRRWFSRWL